jgi:L,D-peptidoglycan transpeptidase YkuD (ErfK/YbiS/YcfS/YnhG family)
MAYELSFYIGFNVKNKVKDRGSCIFLHMFSENDYTHGCVAIAKDMMYKLIHIINNYAYIIIVENENQIINY